MPGVVIQPLYQNIIYAVTQWQNLYSRQMVNSKTVKQCNSIYIVNDFYVYIL